MQKIERMEKEQVEILEKDYGQIKEVNLNELAKKIAQLPLVGIIFKAV